MSENLMNIYIFSIFGLPGELMFVTCGGYAELMWMWVIGYYGDDRNSIMTTIMTVIAAQRHLIDYDQRNKRDNLAFIVYT